MGAAKTPKTKRGRAVKMPVTVPAEILAELSGFSLRRIHEFREAGVIPAPGERGEYDLRGCMNALCEKLRSDAKANPAQRAADMARRDKAEADSAQIKAAKDAGLVMLVSDAVRMWEDGFVRIRDIIMRHRELNGRQKTQISEKLKAVTLRMLDEEGLEIEQKAEE